MNYACIQLGGGAPVIFFLVWLYVWWIFPNLIGGIGPRLVLSASALTPFSSIDYYHIRVGKRELPRRALRNMTGKIPALVQLVGNEKISLFRLHSLTPFFTSQNFVLYSFNELTWNSTTSIEYGSKLLYARVCTNNDLRKVDVWAKVNKKTWTSFIHNWPASIKRN